MKAVVSVVALLVAAAPGWAQRLQADAVPSAVQAAFAQAYPAAKGAKWSKEGAGYEVEFRVGRGTARQAWEVSYDAQGQLVSTSRDIAPSALPEAVRQAIAQQFAGYRIREAEEETEGGVTRYEVELRKGRDEAEATFEPSGRLVEVEQAEPKEKQKPEGKRKPKGGAAAPGGR